MAERHSVLRRDRQGALHASDGPAIAYPDGWAIYALHGVRVPQALVMTSAEHLSAVEWIVKQENAEIRREAVRKIGIERVCQQLKAQVVDRQGEMYELLLLDMGDTRRRPYLKMRNPSVPGVYHVEGIHPNCKTVEEALRWRNDSNAQPVILT